MGVPFEALLPYGIMVRCAHARFATAKDSMLTSSYSLPYAYPRLTRIPFERHEQHTKLREIVLRRFRRWSLQDQEHSERRQEGQALGGPVGQTEYVTLQWHQNKEKEDSRASVGGYVENLSGSEGRMTTES